MKFKAMKLRVHTGYITVLDTDIKIIGRDEELAHLLNLEFNKYVDLAKSYGASYTYQGLKFNNRNDINRFIQYLNNKYLLVLKLTGTI